MKGFSSRNLKYLCAFAGTWPKSSFVQEVLAQLPWYHQIAMLDKQKTGNNGNVRIGTTGRFWKDFARSGIL